MTEPVRKTLTVETTAERAFRVFTAGIDRWWPREHHIGASPMARAVLEPGAGGRWYSIHEDGTEVETGKVLVWEPPHRLVVTWQITAAWKYDPDFVTEIEVRFVPEAPSRTRVELEHRNLDRYGDGAAPLRAQIDPGWGSNLDRFGAAAAAPQSLWLLRYESTAESRGRAMALFPAHKAAYEAAYARGELILIGRVADSGDALSLFTSRAAAESFRAADPFVREGVVTNATIVEWLEVLR